MPRTSRAPLAVAATLAAALTPLGVGTASGAEPRPAGATTGATVEATETCSPTPVHRPVCPARARPATATFLDPTARVTSPDQVEIGSQVYVAPFAVVAAGRGAPVTIGAESNLQDNVRVAANVPRAPDQQRRIAAAGIDLDEGVRIGERVILAHGSEVRGPARLGVDSSPYGNGGARGTARAEAVSLDRAGAQEESTAREEEDAGVFLSFGAQVDGAIIERDVQLSALSRVGPGVRVRSGRVVLPGKNVTRQEEADDLRLGKVRRLTEADIEFNKAVIEVNVGLARSYTQLYRDDASAVRGINLDPGGNEFDKTRDTPTVESDLCTGPEVRRPGFRNRVIGDVCFEDSVDGLDRKMGSSISIRADEGGPFGVGTIADMDDRVTFHALEHNVLRVGDRVSYGDRAIVHGGGRPQVDPNTGLAAPTVVGNDVRLEASSVVFRSLLRNGTTVGFKSAVVGSQTRLGQVIPDRVIYANDEVFGRVEW